MTSDAWWKRQAELLSISNLSREVLCAGNSKSQPYMSTVLQTAALETTDLERTQQLFTAQAQYTVELDGSNTDGSFTMAVSNSFLSPLGN